MILEDELLKYLNYKDGFYVECGSNDGLTQTNTLKLEKLRNWSGILIDASKKAYEQCLTNRDNEKNIILNNALVSFDYKDEFVCGDFDGSPMGSIGGVRLNRKSDMSVKARTIDSILKEYNINKVDVFVVDVEGFELEVLKGIDYQYCSPEYLLIEVYNKDYENIYNFLIENNYELICNLSGYNHIDNPHWDGTHNDYLYKKIK